MMKQGKKPPFNTFGSRRPKPTVDTDTDPKGKRDITPVWSPRASGQDDGLNGAYEQGARQPQTVSGAYPSGQIDKAYATASAIAAGGSTVAELSKGDSGQSGKQNI